LQKLSHWLSIQFIPSFSTPGSWCRVFQSRVFQPCDLVPGFPVPRFPPLWFRAGFSSLAFSVAPSLLRAMTKLRRILPLKMSFFVRQKVHISSKILSKIPNFDIFRHPNIGLLTAVNLAYFMMLTYFRKFCHLLID